MVYGAILENGSGIWHNERPFFVQFGSAAEYRKTVTQRQYLVTVLAPATEKDMDRVEESWLKSRNLLFNYPPK